MERCDEQAQTRFARMAAYRKFDGFGINVKRGSQQCTTPLADNFACNWPYGFIVSPLHYISTRRKS